MKMNDFKEVSEILYDDKLNVNIPILCDTLKNMMEEDNENIRDELLPITFVSVSSDSDELQIHQDDMTCVNSLMKDPLGEDSRKCNITKERICKNGKSSESGPQVKREHNVNDDVCEPVPLTDELKRSCNESTNGEENVFVPCDQKCGTQCTLDVAFGGTFSSLCSEGYDAGKSKDLEIKLESICQISENVKEENVFETGSGARSGGNYDIELPVVKQESGFLNYGGQDQPIIDSQQDVSKEYRLGCTSTNFIPHHLELGNESLAMDKTRVFMQIKPCADGKEMKRSEDDGPDSYSPDAATLIWNERNNQCTTRSIQKNPYHVPRSELKVSNRLSGSVHTHSARNFSHDISGESFNTSCYLFSDMETPHIPDSCKSLFNRKESITRQIRTHTGDKPFKCEICEKSFNKKGILNRHTRIHNYEKPYQCDICKSAFQVKCNLSRHMLTHTGEKPFQCEICEKSFNEKGSLQKHIRTHTGEKPYQCDVCKLSFSRKDDLTTHKRTHTGEKPFKCVICKISFNKSRFLVQHKRSHTNKVLFQCDICEKSFNEKGNFNAHMRVHSGDKPFKCDICETSFNKKGNLTQHKRIHANEKPFQCDICEWAFNVKANLLRHMLTHTGAKPFQCEICKSSFTQRGTLITHKRTHTGEKPFKCEICELSFYRKHYLMQHIRIHTNEESFKCDACERSFNEKGELDAHMLVHSGDKPFKCEICEKSFCTKGNLNRHTRTHTAENPYQCKICEKSFKGKISFKIHMHTHTG